VPVANGLKSLGLEKGDRVAIYMGMVPELPIAMLACARLYAPLANRTTGVMYEGAPNVPD
jgi:acyl-coenzyme A synthetase/AMP-(fatty) acid ligase